MPRGVDGMKLAAIIRDRWPPIKVIIVSGRIDDPGNRIPAETVFFSKPYREEQIIDAVKRFMA
jgi:FixJ family two-component response regulator